MIEITLKIDPANKLLVSHLMAMIAIMADVEPQVEPEKVNIFEKKLLEKTDNILKLQETEQKPETAVPSKTLQQVREVLGTKVEAHRDAVKAKLTELGAKNISQLDAKYYDQFFDFLTAL